MAALAGAGTRLMFGVPGGGPNLDVVGAAAAAGMSFIDPATYPAVMDLTRGEAAAADRPTGTTGHRAATGSSRPPPIHRHLRRQAAMAAPEIDDLSPDERDIVTATHDWVKDSVLPVAHELEHANTYPAELIETMKQLGDLRPGDPRALRRRCGFDAPATRWSPRSSPAAG